MVDVFRGAFFMLTSTLTTISPDDICLRALPDGDKIAALLRDRIVKRNNIARGFSLERNYLTQANKVFTNIYEVPAHVIDDEMEFCRWLESEFLNVKKLISMSITDDKYRDKELVLDFIRKAVMIDRWFDSTVKSRTRSYSVRHYMGRLWHLQMGYRLLYRRDAILVAPEPNQEYIFPAYQELDYFLCGDSFPVHYSDLDELNVPIAHWTPDRVFAAMKIISRARNVPVLLHKTKEVEDVHSALYTRPLHEKGIVFASMRQMSRFQEYIVALVDRLAMLAYFPCEVDAAKFYTEYPMWFKSVKIDVEVEDIREKMGIHGGRIDTLRKVGEHRLAEDAKIQKTTGFDKRIVKAIPRKELIKMLEQSLEKEMNSVEGIRRDIRLLEENLKELQLSAQDPNLDDDIARDDAREAVLVQDKINEKRKLLEQQEEMHYRREQKEKRQKHSGMLAIMNKVLDLDMDQDKKEDEDEDLAPQVDMLAGNLTLQPGPSWYYMNMCLSDYLSGLHFKLGSGVAPVGHEFVRTQFLQEVMFAVKHMDDSKIQDAKRWMISHLLTSWEREVFRMDLEGETNIDLYSVWQSIYRTSIQPDPGDDDWDDEELSRSMDDFPGMPKKFTELLTRKCKYHLLGRAYIGWYILYQMYNTLLIDRWFFYWEFENEYFAANHPDVKSPVMTRIGCEWAIVLPVNWKVTVPELIYCGYDFFDCVSLWILKLKEHNWMVHKRNTGDVISFVGSPLYLLLDTATESKARLG